MSIVVSKIDALTGESQVIEFLRCYLSASYNAERFRWLYCNNPFGVGHLWTAVDDKNGELVGVAGGFPRRLYKGGVVIPCCLLGDFCIHPGYRSLGPALRLQKVCLSLLNPGSFWLAYDFPSQSMLRVYRRLRVEGGCNVLRLAKPLRVDRRLRATIGSAALSRPLSSIWNIVLKTRDSLHHVPLGLEIGLEKGPCGQEFSELAVLLQEQVGIWGDRSAEFLNWRFLQHPILSYEILTVRRSGTLQGYVFFSVDKEDAIVGTLNGFGNKVWIKSLLIELFHILRNRGIITLSFPVTENYPWLSLLFSLGFSVRETSPMVICCLPNNAEAEQIMNGRQWQMMQADRDS